MRTTTETPTGLAESYAQQIDANREAFKDARSQREVSTLVNALRAGNGRAVRTLIERIDGWEAWSFVPSDKGARRIVGPLITLSRRLEVSS